MSSLIITPGDPAGVGPEVAVAALLALGSPALIVGQADVVLRECARQGLRCEQVSAPGEREGLCVFEPPCGDRPVEIAALDFAVEACLSGRASALVTGPIHKKRLAERGFKYPGHTGYLGALCGVRDPVMAFVGASLRVVLLTVHVPLSRVPSCVEPGELARVIRLAHRALRDDLGIERPRLVVAGLNPHAGEEGLLGTEELESIVPACERCRAEGIEVLGPVSAETAARWAATGRADIMVAMYHDQGLIPLKLLDFGRSVNWTLGLPILRTSVDHGTADDISGRGQANPGSMIAAVELARTILSRRSR